jgi:8-oxo-dGTP pyrophosphatase MutT (NUDIX family)
MRKFSNIKTAKVQDDALYKGNYLKVIDLEGWEIVEEKDMVICVPYLVNQNKVILRLEDIPPYKKRFKNEQKFFTVMSGCIEEGESKEDTLKRELEEECGIQLLPHARFEFMQPLMVSKGNIAQFNICLLAISDNDYVEVKAKGDGSKHEVNSGIVKINARDMGRVRCADIITSYTLNLMLQQYGTI